jgi:hypothetical protein
LRIDFPGFSGAQSLEQISWEEFFEKFDEQDLAFLYQETTARGLRSNFNKLIKRPAAKIPERSARAAMRTTATASHAKSTRKSAGTPAKASRTQPGRRKTSQ